VRFAPTGEPMAVNLPFMVSPTGLAADSTGGVWFSDSGTLGGHVNAAGEMTFLPQSPFANGPEATAIAVAPDGRPWLATGTCRLLRVNAAGTIEHRRAPIPARELAFDPTGTLWLASATRVARAGASTDGCDDRPPSARVRPDGSVRRGVRITVAEAAVVSASLHLFPGGRSTGALFGPSRTVHLRAGRGGTVRLRIPKRWRLERGDVIAAFVGLGDRDGNENFLSARLRVKR
jgi:hypothetical protein